MIISFHLNTWKTIQLFDWHKDNTNTSSWYLTLMILSENKNKMSIIYNKQWIKDISLELYSWFHNMFSMCIITVQHNTWCVYQYLESESINSHKKYVIIPSIINKWVKFFKTFKGTLTTVRHIIYSLFSYVIIRWFILKTDKMVDVTEKKTIIRINLSTDLFPFWWLSYYFIEKPVYAMKYCKFPLIWVLN